MATQDQLTADELAYSQAFGEEPGEVSENDVMDADQAPQDEVIEEDDVNLVNEVAEDEEGGEAPPAEALVLGVEQDGEEKPTDPKDIQREKSWEGRLRAREAELAAREKALEDRARADPATPSVADPVDGDEAESVEERVKELTSAVKDGSMTAEDAMKILSGDFGEDFANTISALVRAVASESADAKMKALDERLGNADSTLSSVIADIKDDRQRRHFEAISDAHPDFVEIAEGEMLNAYLGSLDEADRQMADTVVATGSAREIIKLLDAVKKHAAPAEPDEEAADAAEGVRSSGLRLPEQPRVADGYEEAWDQF